MNKIKSHFFILVDVYTINKSIIANHNIKNSPIGGVAVFIELVEMDGVVPGE